MVVWMFGFGAVLLLIFVWLLSHLLIWLCRSVLFVCFSVHVCSHPQARPSETEHCKGDSGGLPSQRGGVLHQGDSDPHHERAERGWVLTMKTLGGKCVLAAYVSAVFSAMLLLPNVLLLLIFNTNSCFLQLRVSPLNFHTDFTIKTASVLYLNN